ncbi:Flp pilus assembly protein TadG [Hoeflea sp. IMCC20628]|uniref:TadE/TadG family type IV pilus assembly protein n=1 Tax=Hoeflea sp. IMCC20628 TaxID=1620421 RepID=UPI00063AEEBC|nr:TadE/TadG family type IV pilus assembly protein [Hoeflea sp. IMCC20628]AKI02768.1 Flp pilus assembly protein TadG [Hoeflea sp. IMCC20628]
MTGILIGLRETARKLRGDRAGVGAVEFALIAPVLIVLYMGSLEVSVAMSVNKKLARAASTVADLVTQDDSIDKAFLQSMLNVAQSVMTPFRADGVAVKITGISINGAGVATTKWSWQEDNTRPYVVGSTQTLPNDLAIPNTFLVRTEVEFDHDLLLIMPGIQDVDFRTIHMKKTYHLRQRVGDEVSCDNC